MSTGKAGIAGSCNNQKKKKKKGCILYPVSWPRVFADGSDRVCAAAQVRPARAVAVNAVAVPERLAATVADGRVGWSVPLLPAAQAEEDWTARSGA